MRNDEKFANSLVTTFPTVKHNIICSALNHDRNLILIYSLKRTYRGMPAWKLRSFREEPAIDIFTLEGYHVTRKILLGKKGSNFSLIFDHVRFTDHMIMLCGGLFTPIILTDFSHKVPFTRYKTVFVEFDDTGNIYTNGERNKIAVYSQNLEFREVFEIDLPYNSVIVSLHIRDDTMVALSYNDGLIQVYTVSRFVKSTRKLVNNLKLAEHGPQHLNDICIDQFRNLILSTGRGIRVWQRNGALRSIMFKANEFIRILLTDDSQIIWIFPNGRIIVYRLINMVNYLY